MNTRVIILIILFFVVVLTCLLVFASYSLPVTTMSSVAAANGETTTLAKERKAIVFLHGLGDTPRGWSSLPQQFQQVGNDELEQYNIEYVFPPAPQAPVTISGGQLQTSWFDIFDWPISLQARDDPKGLLDSVHKTTLLLDKLVQSGIKPSNIILGGFSQGGAVALLTSWRYPQTLAGTICLSGWMMLKEEFAQAKKVDNNTPCFWGHGSADPVVLPEQVPVGVALLKENGIDVSMEMYSGMGHSSCPQEIRDVLDFVKSRFK